MNRYKSAIIYKSKQLVHVQLNQTRANVCNFFQLFSRIAHFLLYGTFFQVLNHFSVKSSDFGNAGESDSHDRRKHQQRSN